MHIRNTLWHLRKWNPSKCAPDCYFNSDFIGKSFNLNSPHKNVAPNEKSFSSEWLTKESGVFAQNLWFSHVSQTSDFLKKKHFQWNNEKSALNKTNSLFFWLKFH